jgi:hypothetical protein
MRRVSRLSASTGVSRKASFTKMALVENRIAPKRVVKNALNAMGDDIFMQKNSLLVRQAGYKLYSYIKIA